MASSKTAVFAAVVGNSILAVIKLAVALISGSGAMFAEAVHSIADASNQALLWTGMKRSLKPADEAFHYGYGGERFLFALLSAVGIFVLGCGVTIAHGVHGLLHPTQPELGWMVFAVLAISIVIDGAVLLMAWRAVRKDAGRKGLLAYLRTTTDPTAAAVLLEDLVATLGVLVAFACIGLARWTGDPFWDSLGSILVGLMMGAVAVWLAMRNRHLLLGQALATERQQEIRSFLESRPAVEAVRAMKSRVVGAGAFKLQADLDFNGRAIGEKLAPHWQDRFSEDAQAVCVEFAEAVVQEIALETDRIERDLRARFPELVWLDIESD